MLTEIWVIEGPTGEMLFLTHGERGAVATFTMYSHNGDVPGWTLRRFVPADKVAQDE